MWDGGSRSKGKSNNIKNEILLESKGGKKYGEVRKEWAAE
ncbi:hypothetical protein Tco_0509857, partial [Tanacetum coccineum]